MFHGIKGAIVGEHHDCVTAAEHHNHDTHKEYRKGSESPEDDDARFCQSKQGNCRALGQNSVGEVPELHDSQAHVEAEEVEGLLVPEADAGLSPHAVVVHFVLAGATGAAVIDPWKLVVVADGAVLVDWGVELVLEFLGLGGLGAQFGQFGRGVADADGLDVAPETHEDVQVGQQGHVVRFLVVEDELEVLPSPSGTWVSR